MQDPGEPCDYTGSCEKCQEVESSYKIQTSENNLIVIHTDRSIICSGKKSTEKKTTLYRLEKIISALRNSNGGHFLVHIDGQKEQDRYLEYFDEFISKSFSDLIEDGQLYVNAYSRRWLSELSDFSSFKDFLLLTVNQSAGIATVDFNTKVSSDNEKLNPKPLNIAEILFSPSFSVAEKPKLRGLLDEQTFHENRRIEIKAFKPKSELLTKIRSSAERFVNYIWQDLKLKENLTSMSKVNGGGSFFVGVSELESNVDGYRTKIPQIDGLAVPNVQEISKHIYMKVNTFCQVLFKQTFSAVPEDLVLVHFHPLQGTKPQKHILEVAIRFCDGIVFYDKEGPTAYKIQNNTLYRMDKIEWLKRFEKCFKSSVHKK